MSRESDTLYKEMCQVVGNTVFTLKDLGVEISHQQIADALRDAMASCMPARSPLLAGAMEAAAKILEQ